jgi:tRNA threonylcarbamoyladenosine biosynthesis protein TsaB
MPFDEAAAVLAGTDLALAGTAAPAMHDRLRGTVLSSVRQPDALWVARLAQRMKAVTGPPRPLYLRAPDAKLPGAR